MAVLQKIAHLQGRRDEAPNQALAKELAERKDKRGIREIAENLWHSDKNIQSDCLKVLYEVGALNPMLIADYADDFLKLLQSKNNRLVWGSMTALAAIAERKAADLYAQRAVMQQAIDNGSVITMDNGIKALALVASTSDARRKTLFPYLLNHLATCRPKDVPQRAEHIAVAVDAKHQADFVALLEKRMVGMPNSRLARLKRVIKTVRARVD